jgi:hypothetical protein
VVLLLSEVAPDRGFQAKSKQSERHRQLVHALSRRGGPRVAPQESRLRRGLQREAAGGIPPRASTGNAALRGLWQIDDEAGQCDCLRR